MASTGRMRHLTTVVGSFHGRVVAARLGAEGILVHLKGVDDGPYRIEGMVDVYVQAEQLDLAREILLADAVDDVFDSLSSDDGRRDALSLGSLDPASDDLFFGHDLDDLDRLRDLDDLGDLEDLEDLDGSDDDGPDGDQRLPDPDFQLASAVPTGRDRLGDRPRVRPAAAALAIAMVAVLIIAGIVAVAR